MLPRSLAAAMLAVVPLSLPSAVLHGQSSPWSIQPSAIVLAPFGSNYKLLGMGYGAEVQVRHATSGPWTYGAGAQYTRHGLENISGSHLSIRGFFFEPRRNLGTRNAKHTPYLTARLALLQQSGDLNVGLNDVRRSGSVPALSVVGAQRSAAAAEVPSLTSTGFLGNVGAGVLTTLSPRTRLSLDATIGVMRFGSTRVTLNGQDLGNFGGTDGMGQNLLVRAGVQIALGARKATAPAPATKPAPRPRR